MSTEDPQNGEQPPGSGSGPNWGLMLALLAAAIAAATLIAYRMVYPFFHPHPH